MTLDPSIVLASRVLGTLIFSVAVVGKLRQREEYVGVVGNYRVLPEFLVAPVAWAIVVVEIAIVLSLGTGIGMNVAGMGAIVLLGVFAVVMAINLWRGRTQIDCGCFQSRLRQHLSPVLVVRNVALTATMIPVVGTAATAPMTPGQVVDGIGTGIALFALHQVLGQMLALRESAAALRMRNT